MDKCGSLQTCNRPPHHRGHHGGFRPVDRSAEALLTPRQLAIIALRAQGYTRTEIADRLGIVDHTVREHIAQAYRRLDATCREDAYRRLGWLVLPMEG